MQDDVTERARRAVKVFHSLTPMLNSYAQALSGDSSIRVILSATNGGSTDGKKIYYMPPIRLGDNTSHDRALCDKRDENLQLKCSACEVRQEVLVTIYHEIAHICYKSFESSDTWIADATKAFAFIKQIEGRYAERIWNRVLAMKNSIHSFVELSHHVNPYLPMILNSLEDARVNRALFRARRGTKIMFEASDWQIFENGVEQRDDTGVMRNIRWSEYPLNAQVITGLYVLACGYKYETWFAPEVITALGDAKIQELVNRLDSAKRVEDGWALSFPILIRLRELGFCLDETDPPEEPEKEDDTEENDNEESEEDIQDTDKSSQSGSSSESQSNPESGDSEGDLGLGDSDVDTESNDSEGDTESDDSEQTDSEGNTESESNDSEGNIEPDDTDLDANDSEADTDSESDDSEVLEYGTPDETDRALKVFGHHEEADVKNNKKEVKALGVAIAQGDYFDTSSENISGVREIYYDGNIASTAWGGRNKVKDKIVISEAVLGPALQQMRVAFSENKRSQNLTNLKTGRVNSRVLGKRAFIGDERLFHKRSIPKKRSYFVQIGMDVSGSTVGKEIRLMKEAVTAQAELCRRLGIEFSILAHSTGSDGYYDLEMEIYHIKDRHDPWDSSAQERLQNLEAHCGNLDGHALEYFRKQCDKVNVTDKVILYYTDGAMPATNQDEELVILQREIATCKRLGYTLLGVGMSTSSPEKHGLPTVQVDSETDVVSVVKHLQKYLLI